MRPAVPAALAAACAAVFLAACAGLSAPAPSAGLTFHLYGYGSEPSTTAALAELKGLPDRPRVILHDMREARNGDRYSDLYNFISIRFGIRILPDQIEHRIAPPVIHFSNEMRYFSQYLQPLVCVMRGRALVGVVVGSGWYGPGFWGTLAGNVPAWSGLHVYTLNTTVTETDAALIAEMARIIR